MAMERLNHINGVTPVNSFTTENYRNTLAAATVESITVPADAKYVVFSSSVDFWAHDSTMGAVPTGDVTDGTSALQNPVVVACVGITTLYIISAEIAEVVSSFYMA